MTYGFENTTSDSSEISSILRLRRKPHIEKIVKASTFELAKKKAELEKKDGWSILQHNKKSIRMKKEKPFDEKLEDEVWSIVARMGFDELSKDRHFKINIGDVSLTVRLMFMQKMKKQLCSLNVPHVRKENENLWQI